MSDTNNKSKAITRKPFGILTMNSHVPASLAEIEFEAKKGVATCGHCSQIVVGIGHLQTYLAERSGEAKQQKSAGQAALDEAIETVKQKRGAKNGE